MSAIAVTIFHRPVDRPAFDTWAGELLAAARTAPGFIDAVVSVYDDPRLEPAISARSFSVSSNTRAFEKRSTVWPSERR